jgi:hypothetical protein
VPTLDYLVALGSTYTLTIVSREKRCVQKITVCKKNSRCTAWSVVILKRNRADSRDNFSVACALRNRRLNAIANYWEV